MTTALTHDEQEDLRCLSPAEAARLLAVTAQHVRNLCERQELRAVRVGKVWRIRVRDLQEFMHR